MTANGPMCCPAGHCCQSSLGPAVCCFDPTTNVATDCCNGKCCPQATPTCCSIAGAAPYCANLSSDPLNCGKCGNVCPSSPTAPGMCVGGVCK
jgi:hypothetical protein